MTEPSRPRGVPSAARYEPNAEPNFRWVEGGFDEAGEKHGPYKSWADAGYLHNECTYLHGKVHGPNRVYHPDGSLASVGEWKDGVCYDSTYFRPKGTSPEPFPTDVGENVVAVRFCTRDGRANYTTRYFDADEREVCDDGSPMPARPAGVHEDASFYPSRAQWIRGSIKRGGSNAPVGIWERWLPDGTRVEYSEFDDDGHREVFRAWYPNGPLKESTTEHCGKLRKRETFHPDGSRWRVVEHDEQGRKTYFARYAEDGKLIDERRAVWDGDRLVSFLETDDSEMRCEAMRDGDHLVCTVFEDGVAFASGPIAGGRLVGTWKTLDASGATRNEYDLASTETETSFERDASTSNLLHSVRLGIARAAAPKTLAPEISDAETIPWNKVHACYGKATKFPFYLRALMASEPVARDYAYSALWSEIEHQGSVYEATAKVTPLLLRLLENPEAPRTELLRLLNIVTSAAAEYVADAEAWLAEKAEPGGDDEDEDEDEDDDDDDDDDWGQAVLGTVDAIGAGVNVLFAKLDSAPPEEARLIIGIAGSARSGSQVRERFVAIARTAKDPALRAAALDAIADAGAPDIDELVPSLDDDDMLPRLVAALSIARTFGSKSPAPTVARLREAFEARAELAPRFVELPFVEESIVSYIALALGMIRSPEAFALVPALIASLEDVDGVSATSLGSGLLALAFGRCEKPFMPGFVDVLEALSKSESFYTFNVNAAETLRRYGIDTGIEPEKLAALVAELRAAADPEDLLYRRMHEPGTSEDDDDDDDDDDGEG